MIEIVNKRIEELSKELQDLVEERQNIMDRMNEIQVFIHQKVGSIQELQNVLDAAAKEQADFEASFPG
jgi:uncharacterized protein YoxC